MNSYEIAIAVQNRRSGFVHASKCWESQDHHAYADSLVGTFDQNFIKGIREYADASPIARECALASL